jgi:hypothetical protein
MSEREIIKVLELAESGNLPAQIKDNSVVSISIVKELVDSGLLNAIDASSFGGPHYMEARINPAGREYLKKLRKEQSEASVRGKAARIGIRVMDWAGGIIAGFLIAWLSKLIG